MRIILVLRHQRELKHLVKQEIVEMENEQNG